MGKISALFLEIESMITEGADYSDIAEELEVPVSWVRECARLMEERGELE